MVSLVLRAELPDAAIVALRERGSPRLAHACDHGERWLAETTAHKLVVVGILEQAEETELLTTWASETNLMPAGHRTMHRLPLTAAGELRRRGRSDGVEHGCQLCIDLAWTSVEELKRGH